VIRKDFLIANRNFLSGRKKKCDIRMGKKHKKNSLKRRL
jgi:hypothetical protein